MAGKKSDAESFASRWANKGNENQDTQRFWIDFYQNVLGVEDAVSRLEFEKPVSTDAMFDHMIFFCNLNKYIWCDPAKLRMLKAT